VSKADSPFNLPSFEIDNHLIYIYLSKPTHMPDKSNNPFKFWEELKRRKVVRVITVYGAAAFVIIELVNNITEPLSLPEWVPTLVIVLLAIGLLVSIVMSWIFDITPEGVQKTKPVSKETEHKEEKPTGTTGWKIATYTSAVIIIGLVLFNILNRKRSFDPSSLEKTIAILPFELLGQEDNKNSLNITIPIALSMQLRSVEGFIVSSWRSSSKYKETNLRIPEIGGELKVNYLLTGTVQEQSGNVRIDIELIHAASEEVIWDHSDEIELTDIFQVQRDISEQVASSLKNSFISEDKNLTVNPDAYWPFLTGMHYNWKDDTMEDFQQAIWYFEKAIELDSNFVQAYCKLSTSHSWMYHFYYDHTESRLIKAKKALDKAKFIDPENPEVIFALGIYYYVTHEYEKALEQYIMAENQVIDNYEFYICIGSLYRRKSKLDKAIEYYLKAAVEDSQNQYISLELAETYLLKRDYEKAEYYFNQCILMGKAQGDMLVTREDLYLMWDKDTERGRQSLEEDKSRLGKQSNAFNTHYKFRIEMIDRNYEEALRALNQDSFYSINHQFLYKPKSLYYAEVYHKQNNIEKATAYYDSARIHLEAKISVSRQDSRFHSSLGIAYAGLGKKAEAIREGQAGIDLMPITKDSYRGIFRLKDMARIYIMVGEYDKAIEVLDQLLSMPSLVSVNLLKKEPVWEPLWDLPEFKELIEKHSDN